MTHTDKAREIAFSRHTTDEAYADLIAAALREAETAAYEKAAQVADDIYDLLYPSERAILKEVSQAIRDLKPRQ